MTETLKRLREPATIVLLVIAGGLILSSVALMIWQLAVVHLELGRVALATGSSILSVGWVIALMIGVFSCVLVQPVTPRARSLVLAAAWICGTATALGLVLLVIGLVSPQVGGLGKILDTVGALLELSLKALATVVLTKVARSPLGSGPQADSAPVGLPRTEPVTDPLGPSTDQQPVWLPGQAIGVQWQRAGDAATGAPAQVSGASGAGEGWTRPPRPGEPAAQSDDPAAQLPDPTPQLPDPAAQLPDRAAQRFPRITAEPEPPDRAVEN